MFVAKKFIAFWSGRASTNGIDAVVAVAKSRESFFALLAVRTAKDFRSLNKRMGSD
jgi:hypothetical protein